MSMSQYVTLVGLLLLMRRSSQSSLHLTWDEIHRRTRQGRRSRLKNVRSISNRWTTRQSRAFRVTGVTGSKQGTTSRFQDIDHPRPWGHQTRIIIDIGTFKCWTLWEFGTDPPSYGSVRWICTCLARIPQIRVSNTRLAQAASGCAPSVDVLPIFDVKQQSVRNLARMGMRTSLSRFSYNNKASGRPRIPQIRVSNTRLAQAASGCAPSVDVLPIFDIKQQSVRNPARMDANQPSRFSYNKRLGEDRNGEAEVSRDVKSAPRVTMVKMDVKLTEVVKDAVEGRMVGSGCERESDCDSFCVSSRSHCLDSSVGLMAADSLPQTLVVVTKPTRRLVRTHPSRVPHTLLLNVEDRLDKILEFFELLSFNPNLQRPKESPVTSFKESLQRGDFSLQTGGSSSGKNFLTFLRTFEFLWFSRKKKN
ncbi:hypothetical protein WN51_12309 [Melipona quadrifasciata]|uniref:Uncharacterized protein n=1 Tax=Melipona quadrifasciata TaxID=166423 RepID=A0A0N1IU82_9HYME|nr:hypothetical protein WN51_12309 [Melipona quadrifasciata]